MNTKKEFGVLLVDDSDDDLFLIQRAIRSADSWQVKGIATDGEEALQCLEKLLDADLSLDLIVLDLNLPIYNGFEILVKVRERAETSEIPTIIFSSSSRKSDMLQAYRLGASAYLTKPGDYPELETTLNKMLRFFSPVSTATAANAQRT